MATQPQPEAPKVYKTIEELDDAIEAKKVDPSQITLYLDGGEVLVNNQEGKTIFQGNEREVLIEMFSYFMEIDHEAI